MRHRVHLVLGPSALLAALFAAIGLALACPTAAWAVDHPVLVNDSPTVTLSAADDGTATTSVTIQNPSESPIDVWTELGTTHTDDCTITSPTEDDPEQVDAFRTEKITVTLTAACEPDSDAGTDFVVHTSASAETFEMHANPPAATDPDWDTILTAYLLAALASVIVVSTALFKWRTPAGNDDNPPTRLRANDHGGDGGTGSDGATEDNSLEAVIKRTLRDKLTMRLPGLEPSWKFTDSWAANATVVTAIFTGLFGVKDIVNNILGGSGDSFLTTATVAAAISVGLAGLSPMLLQTLRLRSELRPALPTSVTKDKPGGAVAPPTGNPARQAGQAGGAGEAGGSEMWAEVPAGLYVTPLGMLAAGALTLTATSGQLAVILIELADIGFWSMWASIFLGAAAAVLLIAYAVTATRTNLTTGATRAITKQATNQPEANIEDISNNQALWDLIFGRERTSSPLFNIYTLDTLDTADSVETFDRPEGARRTGEPDRPGHTGPTGHAPTEALPVLILTGQRTSSAPSTPASPVARPAAIL